MLASPPARTPPGAFDDGAFPTVELCGKREAGGGGRLAVARPACADKTAGAFCVKVG